MHLKMERQSPRNYEGVTHIKEPYLCIKRHASESYCRSMQPVEYVCYKWCIRWCSNIWSEVEWLSMTCASSHKQHLHAQWFSAIITRETQLAFHLLCFTVHYRIHIKRQAGTVSKIRISARSLNIQDSE